MFTQLEAESEPFVYQLFRDGPVVFFHDCDWLATARDTFLRLNYTFIDCDAGDGNPVSFEKRLRKSLGFPRGHRWTTNLDAFRDFIGSMDLSATTGLVIAIRHTDSLHTNAIDYLWNFSDVIAGESRFHMLHGQRLLLILQLDNPLLRIKPVGGRKPAWNAREIGVQRVHLVE